MNIEIYNHTAEIKVSGVDSDIRLFQEEGIRSIAIYFEPNESKQHKKLVEDLFELIKTSLIIK